MSVSSESYSNSPHIYEAVSPVDIVRGHNHFPMTAPARPSEARMERSSSESSVSSSLRSPRTPRFAEATSVHSPTEARGASESPFVDPPSGSQSQPDVSDVGFGYVAASDPAQHAVHQLPPASPLKSALKVPGTPGRTLNPLSPTFREEFFVEKQEWVTEKENAKDLVSGPPRISKLLLIINAHTLLAENQATRAFGQDIPSFCQLRLQSDRARYPDNDSDDIPRVEISTSS